MRMKHLPEGNQFLISFGPNTHSLGVVGKALIDGKVVSSRELEALFSTEGEWGSEWTPQAKRLARKCKRYLLGDLVEILQGGDWEVGPEDIEKLAWAHFKNIDKDSTPEIFMALADEHKIPGDNTIEVASYLYGDEKISINGWDEDEDLGLFQSAPHGEGFALLINCQQIADGLNSGSKGDEPLTAEEISDKLAELISHSDDPEDTGASDTTSDTTSDATSDTTSDATSDTTSGTTSGARVSLKEIFEQARKLVAQELGSEFEVFSPSLTHGSTSYSFWIHKGKAQCGGFWVYGENSREGKVAQYTSPYRLNTTYTGRWDPEEIKDFCLRCAAPYLLKPVLVRKTEKIKYQEANQVFLEAAKLLKGELDPKFEIEVTIKPKEYPYGASDPDLGYNNASIFVSHRDDRSWWAMAAVEEFGDIKYRGAGGIPAAATNRETGDFSPEHVKWWLVQLLQIGEKNRKALPDHDKYRKELEQQEQQKQDRKDLERQSKIAALKKKPVPKDGRWQQTLSTRDEEMILAAAKLKGKKLTPDQILDIYNVAKEIRSNKLMALVKSLSTQMEASNRLDWFADRILE
jgi:hypothetical protein